METTLDFKGTGGDLFGKVIGGALLTAITMGIYAPWFQVSLLKYVYGTTTIRGTRRGDLSLEFTGTGGELFKIGLLGALLTGITIGIYAPWFMANLIRYFDEHSVAKARDGATFQLQSQITGGELFKTYLVGALLTGITVGIYAPWFICNLQKLILQRTAIVSQGRAIGRLDFTGKGGDLFVTFLVGQLLTMITLGIYLAWFQVKMMQFMSKNTEITIGDTVMRGDFTGQGGELFVLNLVGGFLTMITFGIYGFWYLAKSLAYQLNHTVYRAERSSRSQVAPGNNVASALADGLSSPRTQPRM